ncbi:MAG: ribokinase [Planctomycetota bacterium]|nr:MAG: ribokinase [Planctomycetota bacterium]
MSGPVLVVAGSVNLDLVLRVSRFPRPGETLGDAVFASFPGGKGANQAVAAARMGARVRFVGAVGADLHGRELRAGLAREGIDVSGLAELGGLPTGVASILVRRDGENQIVVAAGANAGLDPAAVAERLDGAAGLLLQLEVPLPAVAECVRAAVRAGVPVVLNAAPAKELAPEVLAGVDTLIVNRGEALQLLRLPPAGPYPEPAELAARLRRLGPSRVVVTLGGEGAVWRDGEGAIHQPPFRVEALDATAAGDAFTGAFAAELAAGAGPAAALRLACAAGALACTVPGAQPSLPRREAVLRRFAPPPGVGS